MFPHLLDFGPISIKTYGLMVALGFLTGIIWVSWQAERRGVGSEVVMDVALLSMFSSIIGARLLYVLVNWSYFVENPLESIMIQRGGLVLYGGVSLAIIVDIIYLKLRNGPVWEVADLAGPTILLGQAFGRLGCFFNGCCYGQPTPHGWGILFPLGSSAYYQYPDIAIFPLQLVAVLANLLLFLFLWWYSSRRQFPGQIFALYGILYSTYRFFIEFLRGDIERGIISRLSTSQWISGLFFIVFVWFYIQRRGVNKEQEEK